MTRKKIDTYLFSPGPSNLGNVLVPYNLKLEDILLITNVTANDIIYNFADPTRSAAVFFSADDTINFPNRQDGVTTIALQYDTSSMESTDKLQIFINNNYTEFTPVKELIDPVQKLRVSNPENLVDTDFEYGLQSTKWETLQTVNNIPTVYSASGDLPIESITSVSAVNGSKQIRVTTGTAHSLSLGDPISVQGLTLYQAEGYFIVSGVPDSLTFFYELDSPANLTGQINGGYTTIIPAKFYDGSGLPIAVDAGAITDGLSPSSVLVETVESHGFSQGTKLYLRNTVGPKDLIIDDPTATAPDGRPYVDTLSNFSFNLSVDNDTSTGRGTFREPALIAQDWQPTYSKYLVAGDFDTSLNTITWTGHGLHNRACLLFNTASQGETTGGLTDGYVYYVKVLDENTIQLTTDYETISSIVSLSAVDDSRGPVRLGLVYKVERNNGNERNTSTWVRALASDSNRNYNLSGDNTNNLIDLTTIVGSNATILSFTITYAQATLSRRTNSITFYVGGSGGATEAFASFSNTRTSTRTLSTGVSFNALPYVFTNGGRQYINAKYDVLTNASGVFFQASLTWINQDTLEIHSGYDLSLTTYGLGGSQPDSVVAFQGQTPGSYANANEAYSYLANQRTNGRYTTIFPPYSNNFTANNGNGSFNINYSDAGVETFSNSQIFYAFARFLSADRNTLFLENHGFTSTVNASLTIDSTDYANGQRFAYADGSGNITVNSSNLISVKINPVSADLIKLENTASPATDNIVRFPRRFDIDYVEPNSLYNTAYIQNHKITGSETVTYSHSQYDPENPVELNVTNDGNAWVFSTADTNINGDALATGTNPSLTLYKGATYHFSVDSAGHPFYIKTAATTGTGDQYNTGVTGNGTDVGVVIFKVPENAPATLYYSCSADAHSGTMSISELPNNIGGLSFGQDYVASRVNDSRLTFSRAVNTSASATTTPIGYANNDVQNLFIDIETPLGIAPTGASITQIQFRGNFRRQSEYLFVTFADGSQFFIGQNDGQNSSVWQTATNFGTKDISSLLTTSGGKKGFNVTVDPTSEVNFTVSGMTNWWEIRFVVSGESGVVTLASQGSGEQKFSIDTIVGAYDGVYQISQINSSKQFTFPVNFQIPLRRYSFTSTDVDNVSNLITFSSAHNLLTGEKVTYSANGNTNIFTSEPDEIYVIAVDETKIKFATSYISAINNQSIDITPQTGIHYIYCSNLVKAIKGQGTINTTANSSTVTGNGSKFLSLFKRFDRIWIEESGILNQYTVSTITTDENMELFEAVATTQSSTDYFSATQVILRPDGFSLHKPFDGGVDITAGTSPNSKIVRQSRKYFRYQSGKGIQNSFAVNFNPPRLASSITSNSSGLATVSTQELHNLQAGGQVIIKDAEVVSGSNTFNGEFVVAEVIDPFTFTYQMASTPDQVRPGGFPSYYRKNWNDSYIRAGMFDDQNGFFFEYDGQKIYCVRRSSTKQIGGTVSVERGSQVVTGVGTSFSTQLAVNKKIVIRGQSYLVVEISSDTRIVVQPPYRGVSSSNVKATVTVDTRVPQEDWSIDPCDGTGPTGFILDINKIQMAYADYSWYGAGKIRYGWKDQNGEVKYVHEFKHNNRLDESYFRSGNLPGRYEIENGPNANHAPTLFHFGTSVIMDGRFDNDKAYLFTANSKPFAFTNGASFTMSTNATSSFQLVTLNGRRVWVYALPVAQADAEKVSTGTLIRDPSNTRLPEGTYVTQVKIAGASSLIYTSYPATATSPSSPTYTDIPSATTITAGEVTAVDLTRPIPLISIRLAPSVDSSLTGALGEREIINRMQLQLKQAGVTSNQDILVFLIINALPSSLHFDKVQQPSLSQLIEHNAGETLLYGTTIYSLKASSGSTEIDLSELLEMGNSILGGDGIFPAGPDLLTVAVQPQNTAIISGSAPFFCSGKISWSESQA